MENNELQIKLKEHLNYLETCPVELLERIIDGGVKAQILANPQLLLLLKKLISLQLPRYTLAENHNSNQTVTVRLNYLTNLSDQLMKNLTRLKSGTASLDELKAEADAVIVTSLENPCYDGARDFILPIQDNSIDFSQPDMVMIDYLASDIVNFLNFDFYQEWLNIGVL